MRLPERLFTGCAAARPGFSVRHGAIEHIDGYPGRVSRPRTADQQNPPMAAVPARLEAHCPAPRKELFPIFPGPVRGVPFAPVTPGHFLAPLPLGGRPDDWEVPKWPLHSIRMKANEDVQSGGGSIRDQMALTGHKSAAVNIMHYQAADLVRMLRTVDSLSGIQALEGLRLAA